MTDRDEDEDFFILTFFSFSFFSCYSRGIYNNFFAGIFLPFST